jgi:hypothetical protein
MEHNFLSDFRDIWFNVYTLHPSPNIQDVPGGKVNILGGRSIGYSEQKIVYVHVSYSERFPR